MKNSASLLNESEQQRHVPPTCGIPGCNKIAHNITKGDYPKYRKYSFITTAFGTNPECCNDHHLKVLDLTDHQKRNILDFLHLVVDEEALKHVKIKKLW